MGASQRRKGKTFEQFVAKTLRELLPQHEVKRGWQSREGYDDPDVVCWDLWIECKDRKRESAEQALWQAEAVADKRYPVAVTKLPRKLPVVTLRLSTLGGLTGMQPYQELGSVIVQVTWAGFLQILLEREFRRQRAESQLEQARQ